MSRPAPDVGPEAAAFWAAAREHRLVVQHCPRCDRLQHFPRAFCTACVADDLDVVEVSGLGTVYAATVVRRPPGPAFADLVPYVYALVDLDEGVRMATGVVGCDPDAVRIGQRVRAVFEDLDDATVVLFTPLTPEES